MWDADFGLARIVVVSPEGRVQLWYYGFGTIPSNFKKDGFAVVNGAFTLDVRDGKGPQSLWKACPDVDYPRFNIAWNAAYASGCVVVELRA